MLHTRAVLCTSRDLVLDLFPKPEHGGVFTAWLVLSGKSSASYLAVTMDCFDEDLTTLEWFCLGTPVCFTGTQSSLGTSLPPHRVVNAAALCGVSVQCQCKPGFLADLVSLPTRTNTLCVCVRSTWKLVGSWCRLHDFHHIVTNMFIISN